MAFNLSDWDGSGGGKLPVKAELTTSPGISVLDGPTTNVKSGTQKSTVKTAVKPVKTRVMRKKDLTEEEYFNPPAPTYSSGDNGLSLLSYIPNLESKLSLLSEIPGLNKIPNLSEKIKSKIEEQNNKQGNILFDLGASILSKAPSLVNAPFIGKFIKDQAYKVAGSGPGWVKTNQDAFGESEKTTNNSSRDDLLKAYIYGNKEFEKSDFTPTDDYFKFLPTYSLQNKYGNTRADETLQAMLTPQGVIFNGSEKASLAKNSFVNNLLRRKNSLNNRKVQDLEEVIKTHKPKFYSGYGNTNSNELNLPQSLFYDKTLDLGKYKTGFGWDNELNLPYASLSDAWDFYPVDYEKEWNVDESGVDSRNKNEYKQFGTPTYQQSFLLHKAGNPYKIYERTYIDPKTKRVISKKEILRRRNMLRSMKKPK
jgi:hypothetical protein